MYRINLFSLVAMDVPERQIILLVFKYIFRNFFSKTADSKNLSNFSVDLRFPCAYVMCFLVQTETLVRHIRNTNLINISSVKCGLSSYIKECMTYEERLNYITEV